MEQDLSSALDALESASSGGTGDLVATYVQIRPHLEQLVMALSGMPGDMARVGGVIENLMAGADSLGASDSMGASAMPGDTGAMANTI